MSDNAVQQIQDSVKNLTHLIKTIGVECPKSQATLIQINKIHEKAREADKITHANKAKLKGHYTTALADARKEEALIREALENIYHIRDVKNERKLKVKLAGNGSKETIRRGTIMKMLLSSAQVLPLWIGKTPAEKIPPLCGAIPPVTNYVSKPGDMVAALARAEGDDNWILAEVISYSAATGKYELDDVDEEQKEVLNLPRKHVIPLPLFRTNPETNPEGLFQKDTIVLALYPQTTCFYKAVVTSPPKLHHQEYQVQFEDNTYTEGYSPPLKVAQRYLIAYPREIKKLKQ